MPARSPAVRAPGSFYAALLASVSALTLLSGGTPARAANILLSHTGSPVASMTAATVAAAQQAAVMAQAAQAALARETAALQTAQAAQSAARNLALSAPSAVTDGLSADGLVVDPRVLAGTDGNLWVNADLPVQSTSNGQTTVTVTQTAPRAVLTWQQFNVGKNTTVDFDQSGGNSANGNSWIALNRIDASGVPSQILGSIKADGTVLLINPNGIIFGGSSQVSVHSLIAAAMDLNGPNGVFDANGTYTPVTVNGVAQVTPGGAMLLAPINEDDGDTAFVSSGLFSNSAYNLGTGFFTGSTAAFALGKVPSQGVQVEAGATISTTVSGFDNGGLVALIGPQVSNAGSIATSAGEIILAAGSNVILAEPAANTSETSFFATNQVPPGLSFSYAPPGVTGGAFAVNQATGLLVSSRGNITLVGDAVQQLGLAQATTSITRAGSITVAATETTVFGPGSVTSILPDENGETIPGNSISSFVPPSIAIVTASMDMQPGSLILAPGAAMTVTTLGVNTGDGSTPPPAGRVLLEAGSEIDLAGLTGVTLPVTDTLYTFKVTANDVADTPLAQSLIGQSVTIDLGLTGTRSDGETWVGSPLFASSGAGYLGDIPQSIDQLLTKAGSLNIGAQTFAPNGITGPFADVIEAPGAVINVSGGWIQYTGGMVQTTMLVGSDGHVYNIGSANPFITYAGIAGQVTIDDTRWGVSTTYTASLMGGSYDKPGYIDGLSAGSISLTAANPVLEGNIVGETVTGLNQLELAQPGTGTGGAQATPDQLPNGAALAISLAVLNANGSTYVPADVVVLDSTAPDVLGSNFTLESTLSLPATTLSMAGLPTGTAAPVLTYSTDMLSAANLSTLSISGDTELSMNPGASLSLRSGGSVTLKNVTTIDGTLTAHSGSISLSGFATPSAVIGPPTASLLIGPQAVLDVSGLWVNDSGVDGEPFQGTAYINGGSVSISTPKAGLLAIGGSISAGPYLDVTQSIVLAPGSLIDVSSGGYVATNGQLKLGSNGLPVGKGGSLALIVDAGGAWQGAPGTSGLPAPDAITYPNEPNQATVVFGGTIDAESLANGGTFSLAAPTIVIDQTNQIDNSAAATSYVSTATAANIAASGVAVPAATISNSNAGTIVLPVAFFPDSGFGAYSLTSAYTGVTLTANTTLRLQQSNYVLPATSWKAQPTGAQLPNFAAVAVAPLGERQPANLSLTQDAYVSGNSADTGPSTTAGILIDEGASILADPQAAIALVSNGPATILGDIVAPGGSISIVNNGTNAIVSSAVRTTAALDVWIGADAVLDVSGMFVPNPQITAYSTGSVLPGGTITLASGLGAIIALPGAQLDLAGASATAQAPDPGGRAVDVPLGTQALWSNGGTLSLGGSDTSVFFDATVSAAGGAPLATGGTLTVAETTVLQQSGSMTGLLNATNLASILNSAHPYAKTDTQLNGLLPALGTDAFLTADMLNNGGFGSVNLGAVATSSTVFSGVAFSGSVKIAGPEMVALAGNITLLKAGDLNPNDTYTCTGNCIASIGGTTAEVDAGYIDLYNNIPSAAPSLADGTLTLHATGQLDLDGLISISNAAQVNLTSDGDIRLTTDIPGFTSVQNQSLIESGAPLLGLLTVPDNLTLTAHQVYPTTDVQFLLVSTGAAPSGLTNSNGNPVSTNTIAFESNGLPASAPLSAGGAIIVDAETIDQNGTLVAPLGLIQLGLSANVSLPASIAALLAPANRNLGQYFPTLVATQSVALGTGSVTSVSAAGLDIPYGFTVDGATWFEDYTGTVAPDGVGALTAPPAKQIILAGSVINQMPGATLDASGGGDVYASEFVPGTGGSRNVLTTAAAGQTVYALVPGYSAPVAAWDPTFGTNNTTTNPIFGTIVPATVPVGTAVYMTGANGIAAGWYTLLPGMYATLPGAYRVVVAASTTNFPAGTVLSTPDGSQYAVGYFGNAITGARSALPSLFELQPASTWTRYSEIDITSGNSFFASLAAANGTATPRLPIDAGQVLFAPVSGLSLAGTNDFSPASGGAGGEADIAGSNILILSNAGETAPAGDSGYLTLYANQLDNLDITSVLIGGERANTSTGTQITATAQNLDVLTDQDALTAPELLLVTAAPAAASSAIHGLTVESGSIIAAVGTVPSTSDQAITIGTASVSGDGSLLRVSNGADVSVTQVNVPAAPLGSVAVNAGATISGNVIAIDSSGSNVLSPNATLTAANYDLSGNIVNIGGGSAGLVLSAADIANFAGGSTVTLRSASVFNLYDAGGLMLGTAANPIGTLTFDGAGIYSVSGGTTTIVASNVDLIDSQAAPSTNGAVGGPGTGALTINASNILTLDAGAKSLGGFSQVSFDAGLGLAFSNGGSVNAGAASLTLTAPELVVNTGATQSLTTTGAALITAGIAPANPANNVGGALTLTAGSIRDNGVIEALAGNVTLVATSGDVVLNAGAVINAAGSVVPIVDQLAYEPGGTVTLTSDQANVTINSGAAIALQAVGSGYSGSLDVTAAGAATLSGTIAAGASFNDLGGNFTLTAGSLSSSLPFESGFTGSFAATLTNGNIIVPAGVTLTSGHVLLVAETGTVAVKGTIDASGPTGGDIGLYGAGTSGGVMANNGTTVNGVLIDAGAVLLARYEPANPNDPAYANGTSALLPNGGTITLGTVGTWDGQSLNADGSETITSAGSGRIYVDANATLDVSGGAGGTGGSIVVRAPVVTDSVASSQNCTGVCVTFNGKVVGTATGNGVALNAYEVWSTDDPDNNPAQHFDGLIDPAGWYNSNGTRVAGTMANGDSLIFGISSGGNYTSVPTVELSCAANVTCTTGPASVEALMGAGGTKSVISTSTTFTSGTYATLVSSTSSTDANGNTTYTTVLATNANHTTEVTLSWTIPAGDGGTGFTISKASILSKLTTASLTVSNGSGYTQPITVTVTQGSKTATEQYDLAVASIVASSPGPGYSSLPTVTLQGGGGTGGAIVSVAVGAPGTAGASDIAFLDGSGYFTTSTPNTNHTTFYQTTLVDFVENPFGTTTPAAALAANQTVASTDFASVASNLHLQPEVDLVNPDPSINGGNITVVSNWNLGAGSVNGQGVYVPLYRTAAGEPGVLTLRAVNDVLVNATVSDGFYETRDAFVPANDSGADSLLVANYISNNPQSAGTTTTGTPIFDYNPTAAASLMSIVPGINNGSFSYDFVGGAYFASATLQSVDPDAVGLVSPGTVTSGPNPSDSVTLNGHTSYANAQENANDVPTSNSSNPPLVIDIPTLLRTGTGSITIAAAGSVELLDPVAPGVIYTAGALAPNSAGFTPPTVPADPLGRSSNLLSPNGLVSTPVWANGGGSVTITAGDSIVGIETPVDTATSSQTWIDLSENASTAGMPTGEFWSAWYFYNGIDTGQPLSPYNPAAGGVQPSSWINYATFFQGVGALGGGNITLKAGNNIDDISASIPETLQVSGGQSATGPAATVHYYGGGNLLVQAGGNLYSSTFYVGRGSGSIQAGGAVAADPLNPVTGTPTTINYVFFSTNEAPSLTNFADETESAPVPLMLAVQDGFISVEARQAVTLGGVYDPTTLPLDVAFRLQGGALPTSLAPAASGLFGTLPSDLGRIFDSFGPDSGLALTSLSGDVTANTLPHNDGTGDASDFSLFNPADPSALPLSIYGVKGVNGSSTGTIAPAGFSIAAPLGGITVTGLSLMPAPVANIDLLAGGTIDLGLSMLEGDGSYNGFVGVPGVQSEAVPSLPNPALVSVTAGEDITGSLSLLKPADVEAGRDIVNLDFLGENNSPTDITSIIAGRDIISTPVANSTFFPNGDFVLYGPGVFYLQAGRNLGPIGTFGGDPLGGSLGGILAIGDGSNSGGAFPVRSWLPTQGADIYALFGVGLGIDYQAAVSRYVDPVQAATSSIDFLPLMIPEMDQLSNLALSPSQGWTYFESLPAPWQHLLVDRAFLDFLTEVATDYNDPQNSYAGQYGRAYQAIATLFPASLGYTNDATSGAVGATTTIPHGNAYLARSVVETQTGGDINLLGPGGSIYVGSNAKDNLTPSEQGILTLQGGSIRSYTDGSVIVDQSRIFTDQGGDLDLFSGNGDLNAGKGPKSSAAYPPLVLICDSDGYCRVSPNGLVTGAGIGALLTIPGQDASDSNVSLAAPHGTVDAGAAGIRVAGNLNVLALRVLNTFNIQVGGTTTGIPTAVAPNVGALTSASNNAGAATAAATEAASHARSRPAQEDLPSIITVEVIGYGGTNTDEAPGQKNERRKDPNDRRRNDQSYDPTSTFRVIGNGDLTDEQKRKLTEEERSHL